MNINMNTIIKGIAALSLAAFAAGCTKNFEDYNTNKHQATEEQMATDDNLFGAFFQQIERSVIIYRDGKYLDSDYQIMYNLAAETYCGYMAPTLGAVPSTGNFYDKDGWTRSMYVNKFTYGMNAWLLLDETAKEAGLSHIVALGNVLKIATMHQVTDYQGPMPYSQVGKTLTPDYDSQESIYRSFLAELDEAISTLEAFESANPGAAIMPDFDIVYGGNVAKWIRFANSLRLRLAMRCVYADEALAQAEAEKSLASAYGVITDNADNAVVSGVEHHPLYEINVNFNDADTQMNADMDCYLNGYDDPRTFKIAKAASDGKFHGVRNGLTTTVWDVYKNKAGKVSAPNATIYNITWINAAEVYFLRAEGALRGWSMGGTAKNLYEEGIRTSFSEWGATGADSYVANSTAKPAAFVDNSGQNNGTSAPSAITIAWNDNDSFETSLERLMTQKWIAMFPNGCEAWAEYRRTGYPKLLRVVSNMSNGVVDDDLQIRRVPFPISEYSTNPSGVAAGVAALGGLDNSGTKLWWDQKPR